MQIVTSVNGVPIRLTAERWMHIVEARDELGGRAHEVLTVVESPDWVTHGYRVQLCGTSSASPNPTLRDFLACNQFDAAGEFRRLTEDRPHDEPTFSNRAS